MSTVRVATTANGTLASSFENGDTIDGIVLATNDLILIKNQSTATENGVYVVNASGSPTRAHTYRTGVGIAQTIISVIEGTSNAFTDWLCTNSSGSDVIGTNNLTFAQITIRNPATTNTTQTLSNKTFSTAVIITPSTNQLVLSGPTRTATLSAVQPATASRTYTIADAGGNDTFTFNAVTQTLTNKTLTATSNSCRATAIGTSGTNVTISTTAPTTGQVLTATSSTAANWQTPSGGGGQRYLAAGGRPVSHKPSGYTVTHRFAYPGSTQAGTISTIRAVAATDSGGTYSLRIQDITNAATIAEITGQTNTTPQVLNLGTISNIPTGAAVFEMQQDKTGGGGSVNVQASYVLLNLG